MPLGTCRLCQTPGVELRSSHYMPAGIHRIVQAGTPHAIQIAGTIATLSSHHDRAHLLCDACERRFQQQGENWVIANCWRSPIEFPLLDLLERTPTPHVKDDLRVYLGRTVPGVDIDQMVYFASSVFWRGAAHTWSTPKAQTNDAPPNRIHLGPYLEPLRLFLLGNGPFPAHVYLSTWLEFKRDEHENRHAVPPFKAFDKGYHVFRMFIPGLVFSFFVGKAVGPEIQRSCMARSGYLVVCATEGLRNTEIRARVAESETKGKLAALLPSFR